MKDRFGAGSGKHRAGDEPDGGSSGAGCETHSFTGNTPVLMGDGGTKPISEIKEGDLVTNSVPGRSGTETHKVDKVIVTTTDRDYVDLTVTPDAPAPASSPEKSSGFWTRVALGLAAVTAAFTTLSATPGITPEASAATVTTSAAPLTTTYNHPFYDLTQNAFVAAKDLKVGDKLQTPTGTATVNSVRLYQAGTTTFDLTVDGLHTYDVEAGATPVLVHNCTIDRADMARMYIQTAKTFQQVENKANSALALAKVWNGTTKKIEDWAALTSPDPMSTAVANQLSGHTIVPTTGHAEWSLYRQLDVLNSAGGKYEMMGITSSGRFCTSNNCYGGLLGRGLRMLSKIGETHASPGCSQYRAAVNPSRCSGGL
ncbi:polymorphic toxin-type HINT domain-containing protein [Kitasatospora sp. NPDC004240]